MSASCCRSRSTSGLTTPTGVVAGHLRKASSTCASWLISSRVVPVMARHLLGRAGRGALERSLPAACQGVPG